MFVIVRLMAASVINKFDVKVKKINNELAVRKNARKE